jgi:catechol 2,3-dioxygenase
MQVQGLGHVVLKVRSLERSVPFYRDVLGLKKVGQLDDSMAFFAVVDNHHDIALLETKDAAPAAPEDAPGLHHVAFKVGTTMEELQEAKDWLVSQGVEAHRTRDHVATKSIYFDDPDGNRIEVFIESDPSVWLDNPQVVATSNPLELR